MKLDIRYANHPGDAKHYDTDTMRRQFLVEQIFVADEIALTYSHQDRVVFGGAMPISATLELKGGKEFGTDVFLERRELGVINVGGPGKIVTDKETIDMVRGDGLYIGMGTAKVAFKSNDPKKPAKFYMMSSPAHASYPTVKIEVSKVKVRKIGSPETVNVRTINQYVHPEVVKSCQLAMGLTTLESGSVWNTFPCHTHERRMEVYFYFDMEPSTRVFHMFGQPEETRHIVMANEQAVISPSWSIHSGVGSAAYTFIWGMAGENQTFDDMDHVAPERLR